MYKIIYIYIYIICIYIYIYMFSSVDSNGSLWPAYLCLRIKLPWLKNLSPAKTKGALTAVCTSTLMSVLAQRNNKCIK